MLIDLKKNSRLIFASFVVVALGVLGAYLVSLKLFNKSSNTSTVNGAKVGSNEVGILDSNVKYDNATGKLVEGGIGNEGAFHLERDGGPSKYVYLTSSVIDLQSFVGKNVEVWGQTLASKKAGWLMDVAKIKLVND